MWPFDRAETAANKGEKASAEARNLPTSGTIPVSSHDFLAFFGIDAKNLPHITIDSALGVPAVAAAVAFLSRTMAALPLHAYRETKDGPKKVSGKLESVIHDAPNDEMDSFKFRQYFWQQVFTGGRGFAWIERSAQSIEAIWPMDPGKTTVRREGLKLIYKFDGRDYPAADVIDVPYMLKADGVGHYGPITNAARAIQLALAMNDYASNFFAGGGVPPLALTGPLPVGAPEMNRMLADINRAIDTAKASGKPITPIPGGYELKPVGLEPDKGQMVEARRFQVEEIARAFQLPPVFLQDLSRATFSNAEQQDLHLVKHLIGQWAEAFEGELNLKLFGRGAKGRYVEHNLDGLLRGDFKSRIDGITRGIQAGLLTPNEGRALENRPDHANQHADDLFMQGGTVPIGSQLAEAAPAANDNTTPDSASDTEESKAA